jgi:hypothetical protein
MKATYWCVTTDKGRFLGLLTEKTERLNGALLLARRIDAVALIKRLGLHGDIWYAKAVEIEQL